MAGYGIFAEFYDRLMSDCDYSSRADYLLGLFRDFGNMPKLMLDVACGTGSLALEMLNRGVDVIAADPSEDMLAVAREKAADCQAELLLLCQSASELDLYGTVDSAVCTLDSLNHITDYDELCAGIARISLFLEPGGLFIFDVNTEYKHRHVLGDNTFVIDEEDIFCVWRNHFEDGTVDISLDFFVPEDDGTYSRYCEDFSERAYSGDELAGALDSAGLEIVAVYGDMTRLPPDEKCERKIYVTRKK